MLEEAKADLIGRREMGHHNYQHPCKGVRGPMKGYTLIEVLIVVVIILVLSSIGIYLYQRGLAYAKETVCQTNLKALDSAVQLYAEENDALPASLGHLKLEHLEKGYAKAMEDRGWLKKFSLLLVKLDASEQAYAEFLTYGNLKGYGVTEAIFHCPADPNGGVSYGINGHLAGKDWMHVSRDQIVVGDSDKYVFHTVDELAKRHDHKALTITKIGEIVEADEEGDDKVKVTVCHEPGTAAEGTITISRSALAEHLIHGDIKGACRADVSAVSGDDDDEKGDDDDEGEGKKKDKDD
jgi:prepilin-type N-terminal cleavage/methylation domain-containing protein